MNILWLQSAGCGGCTMSLLCAESPGVLDLLKGAGLQFLWHPALSEQSGGEVRNLLAQIEADELSLDILCVEGSILTGPKGTGKFQMLSGTGRSMLDWVQSLAHKVQHVVAVGTCATYGGMTSAGGNPSGAIGVQFDGDYPGALCQRTFAPRLACLSSTWRDARLIPIG